MILRDQVAIVAGGSKGIGRAVTRRFAQEGAVVAVVSRDRHAVDSTVAEVVKEGGKAIGIVADCTKTGEVRRATDTVIGELGAPDILVNLVGGATPELVARTSDDLYEDTVDRNVRPVFLLSRAIAPVLMEKGRGKIIHTASIGAKMPMPGLAVYDGCKAFVVAFTRDLALELGRFGVNVNCVCPGHIPTEGASEVGLRLAELTGMDPGQLMAMVSSRMAIHRFPSSEDIAGLYLFLASPQADCMTGQAVNYSCGLEMR